jgi:heme-degrading monooxygenase HmoA
VRSWRYLPAFLFNAYRAARQARQAPGNHAISLLRDADLAFWTRTLWTDEKDMRAFMLSGVHRRIMSRLPRWCDEAAVAHWLQSGLEPPSWPEAYRRLRQEGRPSRVEHPSAAQRQFAIPEPRTRAEVRLK